MNQSPDHSPATQRIAFIQAQWHEDIVAQAHAGFIEGLEDHGLSAGSVENFFVPGSLEIPLRALTLAESGRYALIVAAGLIVDGGIYRHDFVARTVLDGMMRVQLDTRVPVLSVVLTPHHFQETHEHHAFFHSHLLTKGREAAEAAVRVMGLVPGYDGEAASADASYAPAA